MSDFWRDPSRSAARVTISRALIVATCAACIIAAILGYWRVAAEVSALIFRASLAVLLSANIITNMERRS